MNIILLLSMLIPPTMSQTPQNEDFVYFLATALFMADAQGNYVLLDKALPISIEEVIKEDVLSRLKSTIRKKAIIKVMPKPAQLQPFEFHTNTMKLDLRKMASRKNFWDTISDGLKNFWDYDIMNKGRGKSKKKINLSKIAKPNPETNVTNAEKADLIPKADEAKQLNKTMEAKQLDKSMEAKQLDETKGSNKSLLVNKFNVTKGQPTSPDDYVPNDIYYNIEKKCVNWSDGCQLKSPPIFDLPSSTFKFSPGVLVPPKFNLWDP